MTVILTSASCMAHFWDGINMKYDQRAPALISAWFTYLHRNDSLSDLQREYDPLGTIVFKFLCISSA